MLFNERSYNLDRTAVLEARSPTEAYFKPIGVRLMTVRYYIILSQTKISKIEMIFWALILQFIKIIELCFELS